MTAPLGLLCIHAHPDDEVISTGGALMRAVADGHRAAVLTCTDGERGASPGLDGPRPSDAELAALRHSELTAALAILGTEGPRYLGYRDTGMVEVDGRIAAPDDAGPETFWHADVDEAVGRVVAHIREWRPDVVVIYDAYGGYGHPDHLMAHRVGLLACEAAAVAALYPAAGTSWRVRKVYASTFPRGALAAANEAMIAAGVPSPFGAAVDPDDIPMGMPDELVTTTLDVSAHLDTKLTALRAHRSQVGDDSFFFNLPEGLDGVMFATEWYARLRSDVAVPDDERDLFAGLTPTDA